MTNDYILCKSREICTGLLFILSHFVWTAQYHITNTLVHRRVQHKLSKDTIFLHKKWNISEHLHQKQNVRVGKHWNRFVWQTSYGQIINKKMTRKFTFQKTSTQICLSWPLKLFRLHVLPIYERKTTSKHNTERKVMPSSIFCLE